MRTHYCGFVDEKLTGQEVTVAGWVHRRRDHGGVIFVDLRDREGLLQVVFDPDAADMFKEAERLRSEFVIRVKGLVRARPGATGPAPRAVVPPPDERSPPRAREPDRAAIASSSSTPARSGRKSYGRSRSMEVPKTRVAGEKP